MQQQKTTSAMQKIMFQERSRRIAEELQGRGKNCTGPAKETKTCSLEELQTLFWTTCVPLKVEGNGQRLSDSFHRNCLIKLPEIQ
jgi:hypothetical protein